MIPNLVAIGWYSNPLVVDRYHLFSPELPPPIGDPAVLAIHGWAEALSLEYPPPADSRPPGTDANFVERIEEPNGSVSLSMGGWTALITLRWRDLLVSSQESISQQIAAQLDDGESGALLVTVPFDGSEPIPSALKVQRVDEALVEGMIRRAGFEGFHVDQVEAFEGRRKTELITSLASGVP